MTNTNRQSYNVPIGIGTLENYTINQLITVEFGTRDLATKTTEGNDSDENRQLDRRISSKFYRGKRQKA